MRNLEPKLASAFACISYNMIITHKEDLLYELPQAISHLSKGKDYILTVRSTGADGLNRFMACIEKEEDRNYINAIEYAKCSLGVDYVVLFEVEEDLKLIIRADKDELPYGIKSDLECRGIKYEFQKGLI